MISLYIIISRRTSIKRLTKPKNKIQFQKVLSLTRFLITYGTEKQCGEKFFRARWSQGFRCPQCEHNKYYLLPTRNLYQCGQCRHQCSLKSDTIFESFKLQISTWFLDIFFLTQSKEGMSALNLRRLLGISANAALKMKHKLQHVMMTADDCCALRGLIELDDVYWGGKRSGGKRGIGAPGKHLFLQLWLEMKKVIQRSGLAF